MKQKPLEEGSGQNAENPCHDKEAAKLRKKLKETLQKANQVLAESGSTQPPESQEAPDLDGRK